MLLPTVVDRGQATATAVHVAVYRAALQLRGCHAGAAHQLAGEAVEMLVAYLASVHHLRDAPREVQHEAMRTWAFGRAAATVSWAMRAAAEHWRAELDLARLAAAPSDGQLLMELGLVLQGCAGPVLGPRLSTLVAHVCHAYCPAAAADERAEHLGTVLASWLNEHRVLQERQISVAGLDEWAASAAMVFLRAAVAACARCQGGEAR